jgi:UDP-N-acetylmuramate: L-alanyl-gamma-D-glutamyl-meso-diaminopimelate ligase
VGKERIIAVLEPRSNSMRMGAHSANLGDSLKAADLVLLYAQDGLEWDPQQLFTVLGKRLRIGSSVEDIVKAVAEKAATGDHILVMSNGGFEDIHERLLQALKQRDKA